MCPSARVRDLGESALFEPGDYVVAVPVRRGVAEDPAWRQEALSGGSRQDAYACGLEGL